MADPRAYDTNKMTLLWMSIGDKGTFLFDPQKPHVLFIRMSTVLRGATPVPERIGAQFLRDRATHDALSTTIRVGSSIPPASSGRIAISPDELSPPFHFIAIDRSETDHSVIRLTSKEPMRIARQDEKRPWRLKIVLDNMPANPRFLQADKTIRTF